MLIRFIKKITVLSFFLYSGVIAANDRLSYNKTWTAATIIGSFSEKSSFKYYLEPQLRLISKRDVFNQLLLLSGLGYQFNEAVMLFVGYGGIASKAVQNNNLIFEKRLWQQLNWRLANTSRFNINSRTRLEERKLANFAPMSFRLRERMWLRIPLEKWKGYSLSCFDEVFFNLNHPQWTSPYLFEQNRAFIGFARQLSHSSLLDFGYLNQFIHSNTNEFSHVLLLNFTVSI